MSTRFEPGSAPKEISIGDLALRIAKLVGRPVEVSQDDKRLRPDKSEVERLMADNTKAQKVLGWSPAVGLDEGLEATIEWMREHLRRYRPDVYAV